MNTASLLLELPVIQRTDTAVTYAAYTWDAEYLVVPTKVTVQQEALQSFFNKNPADRNLTAYVPEQGLIWLNCLARHISATPEGARQLGRAALDEYRFNTSRLIARFEENISK